MAEIHYRPIGIVHSPLRPEEHTPPRRVQAHDIEGTVEVLPEYAEGLRDIEGFSHVVLLCHLHLSNGYSLSVRPPAEDGTHGVFATRSPRRPNPISLTVVRLGRIEDNTLHVTGIDLVDGTPLLDIKPYIPTATDGEVVRTGWMEARRES